MKIVVPSRGQSNLQRSPWSWLQVYWGYSCWKDGNCIVPMFWGRKPLDKPVRKVGMDAIQSNVIDLSLKYRITFCTQSAILFLEKVDYFIQLNWTSSASVEPKQNIPLFKKKLHSEHRKLYQKRKLKIKVKELNLIFRVKLSSHLQLSERTKRRGMTVIMS